MRSPDALADHVEQLVARRSDTSRPRRRHQVLPEVLELLDELWVVVEIGQPVQEAVAAKQRARQVAVGK